MAATHYINWVDAQAYLDKEAHSDPDVARLEAFCVTAETQFDNRLRHHYSLPFTRAANLEAFTMAQQVTARWAAAAYMRWSFQTEGTPDQSWYAEQLDNAAEEFVAMLESRRVPENLTEATDPVLWRAIDGDPTNRDPIFTRSQLASGTGTHW